MSNETDISAALRQLMLRDNVSPYKVSADLNMPKSSVYALLHQTTDKVSLSTLKTLADYFHVGVDIFFDLNGYVEPVELTADERTLLTLFRKLNEEGKMRSREYIEGLCSMKKFLEQDERRVDR